MGQRGGHGLFTSTRDSLLCGERDGADASEGRGVSMPWPLVESI